MERCYDVGPSYASYAGLVGPQTLYALDINGVSWEQNPALVLHTLYTITSINARGNSMLFQDNLAVRVNHFLPRGKTPRRMRLPRSSSTSPRRWPLQQHGAARRFRSAHTNSAEARVE